MTELTLNGWNDAEKDNIHLSLVYSELHKQGILRIETRMLKTNFNTSPCGKASNFHSLFNSHSSVDFQAWKQNIGRQLSEWSIQEWNLSTLWERPID